MIYCFNFIIQLYQWPPGWINQRSQLKSPVSVFSAKLCPQHFLYMLYPFLVGTGEGGESYRDAKNGEFGEPVGAISPQSDFRRLARILGIFMLK